jgi:DNA adenine methylase
MAGILEEIIYANDLQGAVYAEPFAGGAGAGLKLLESGHVDRIVINDADYAIFCFWWSVMNRTEQFIDRIQSTILSVDEWVVQRSIYRNRARRSRIDIGFATFYLNRCNRSGIIKNAGPIGGIKQMGDWKIDARFNRRDLAKRVQEIGSYADRIITSHIDAKCFIENLGNIAPKQQVFVYADPPYYLKGRELYLNHYTDDDHETFAEAIQNQNDLRWVVTYDNVPQIRELYVDVNRLAFSLRYSAHHSSNEGKELLIFPKNVIVPKAAKDKLSAGGFFR